MICTQRQQLFLVLWKIICPNTVYRVHYRSVYRHDQPIKILYGFRVQVPLTSTMITNNTNDDFRAFSKADVHTYIHQNAASKIWLLHSSDDSTMQCEATASTVVRILNQLTDHPLGLAAPLGTPHASLTSFLRLSSPCNPALLSFQSWSSSLHEVFLSPFVAIERHS